MVIVVLVSLACGIAFTIGAAALLAVTARKSIGQPLLEAMSGLERGARVLQGIAGGLIVVIAGYSIWSSV